MPYSYPDAIPQVAKNWEPDEIERCISAANQALIDGKTDEESIYICIHAAGKSKKAIEVLEAEIIDWKEAAEPSVNYLDKFRQMVLELGYFSKTQIESIMKAARGYAGGKAKAQGHVDGLAFEDILPPKIKGMIDSTLILLHRRLHNLYEDSANKEAVETAHGYVMDEMAKRKLTHYRRDELDGG